jgi:cytosol alanyl aminopeptidase
VGRATTLALFAGCFAAAGCLTGSDVTKAPLPAPTSTVRALPTPAPLPTGRLPDTARPRHYQVSLVVDPAKDHVLGDLSIDVDVPAATESIVLHGRELTILRAEVTIDGQAVQAKTSFRASAGTKEVADELVLTPPRPVPAGRAEIRIAYSAPISDKLVGLYRYKEGSDAYVFTQFEPTDARRMMPCFDEPGFKVPFDLKVTVPKGDLAVANTDEVERTVAEDGRSTTFRFATTPPLPTYLFAFAVGPLEIRQGQESPVRIRLITTKGKGVLGDLVLEAAAADVKLLGEYFGRPYPYPKLDLLAVPEFGFGAMENAGLITFREELILLDPQRASTEARRGMATTVAHEISHHWFGNLVTMKWWDDLWLNEGFATWMESKIVDVWRPAMNARLTALAAKDAVMGLDALDSARAVRQPVASVSDAEEAFDGITYDKGAAVLGMLEAWLGPEAFRDGIRVYLKSHEHGSATAADLFEALSQVSKKDVSPIASTFLDQPGVPLVRAQIVCDKGDPPKVTFTQSRYRARPPKDGDKKDAPSWRIPLCIRYEGAVKDEAACGLIDGATGEIALPPGHCPKWVYPNAEDKGYFRFALPKTEGRALAAASKQLSVSGRIGLVTNAWALVSSGDLGADDLFDLLRRMHRERERLVVEQMIAVLSAVSDAFIDEGTRPAFRAYVSSLLLPIAKELGWDAKPTETDEQRLLRKSVLSALSRLADDPWLAPQAGARAQAFLADPRSVDPDLAAIALRASTRRAGDARFAELTAAMRRAKTPEDRIVAVGALGSFADPQILRRALDRMLTSELRIQDAFYLFDAAMTWASLRPVVRGWLKDHFAELKGKMPDFAVSRLSSSVETICDAGERAEAAQFYGEALKATEGADRALEQALEKADLCIELRAREGARAKKALAAR